MADFVLGVPAVRQIVSKMKKGEKEEVEMAAKLERSCAKFDRAKRGALTVDEYWNVCRVQNGIDVTKDDVKNILSSLPQVMSYSLIARSIVCTCIHGSSLNGFSFVFYE